MTHDMKSSYPFAGKSTRRRFLATLATTAVAGTVAPRLRAAPEPWPLRLSTSSIHFKHLPIEKVCRRIARLGFEGLDIWSAFQGCPHLDDIKQRLGPAGLKKTLAENRLKLFAFSVYKGGYKQYADLLGKAGGGVAVRGSSGPCKPAELRSKMKAFLGSLEPLVELARENKTRLAIENHGHALLDSVDSLKAFVDLNDSPHLGIALAPYHIQAAKMSVEEAIRTCGKQLFFFYAWQHAKGTKQLPGHGPADFTPWLAALAEVRYKGYVNVFMHGDVEPDAMDAALEKSRDYLKASHAKIARAAKRA